MPTPTPLIFPMKGLNQTAGDHAQPDGTTQSALNVRPFDAIAGKLRGGRRPGLSKWHPDPVVDGQPVQVFTYAGIPTEFGITERFGWIAFNRFVDNLGDSMFSGEYGILGRNGRVVWEKNIGAAWPRAISALDEDGYGYTFPMGLVENVAHRLSPRGEIVATYPPIVDWFILGPTQYNPVTQQVFVRMVSADDSDERIRVFSKDAAFLYDIVIPTASVSVISVFFAADGTTYVGVFDSGSYFTRRYDSTGTLTHSTIATGVLRWITGTPSGEIITLESSDIVRRNATLDTILGTWSLPWLLHTLFVEALSDNAVCVVTRSVYNEVRLERRDKVTGTVVWSTIVGTRIAFSDDATLRPLVTGLGSIVMWDDGRYEFAGAPKLRPHIKVYHPATGELSAAFRLGQNAVTVDSVPIVVVAQRSPSQSPVSRAKYGVSIAGGTLRTFDPVGSLATPTNGTDAFVPDLGKPMVQPAYGRVFIVDGTNSKFVDILGHTVKPWADDVAAGTLPTKARLIALYRGRLVLSGSANDPSNWFMSRVGDPFDWDYGPSVVSPTDPVAGNNSDAGLIGDLVTAMIPFSDDTMLMGCDSSIWQMTGDPAAGGAIDLVTNQTGIVFGKAWAKDPQNVVYFVGVDGIYRMAPGDRPANITIGRLDRVLDQIDFSQGSVSLAWNPIDRQLWVTILDAVDKATRLVLIWDQRTDSWWKDEYPANVGPSGLAYFDGDDPEDRSFLLCGYDGFLRQVDNTAGTDDGIAISNHVRFPPLLAEDGTGKLRVSELSATVGEGSGPVDLVVYGGQTVEQATASTEVRFRRQLHAGRNPAIINRMQGHALSMQLRQDAGTQPWALERLGCLFTPFGRGRQERR